MSVPVRYSLYLICALKMLEWCNISHSWKNVNQMKQYMTSLVVEWSGSLTTNHEVPGSRFYHGNFSLQGKIPVVTTVWVVSRFRLKAPPGISSSCISPLTSSGQRSHASWASQPQKLATLSPQPGGKPRKFIRTCCGIGKKRKEKEKKAIHFALLSLFCLRLL